jgi:hypothetical protein
MTEYLQVWQCIGCGRIEAPQPCIGVCRDRKVLLLGKDEHERVLAEVAALRDVFDETRARLERFARARPHEGQWERAWLALQEELRRTLAWLAQTSATPPAE